MILPALNMEYTETLSEEMRARLPSRKSANDPIRIIIADDHAIVREGLASVIEREKDMTVVAEAANGAEAESLFFTHHPDIILMDLRMPLTDGATAIKRIINKDQSARIIVLTVHDGDEYIYRALKSGARGYLLKDAPVEELLEAIRQVFAGRKQIPPDIAQKLAERVSEDELTTRETEILKLMAEGLTNQQIAEKLFISEGTVKYHINHIFSKLAVADRAGAIIAAIRRGIAEL